MLKTWVWISPQILAEILKQQLLWKDYIDQGWATPFDSRATLETKLVDAGHYKYDKDLFDMTFEKKEASQKGFF